MGLLTRIRNGGARPFMREDGQPLSVTGRGHVNGFLNLEELNQDLQGRQGLEIFDRMYRTDGDVRQVVGLVTNPIVSGTWEVEPHGGPKATQDAIDDAAFVRWCLFENMSPNLRGHLMEVLPLLFRSGFTPSEPVWEVAEYEGKNVTVPRTIQIRLPRTIYRWKQDAYGNLEAIEQYLPVPRAQVIAGPNVVEQGNPLLAEQVTTDTREPDYRQTVWLPATNLIYYRVGAEGDNWEGQSMLRACYKNWLFKDAIERMDAIAQEKEALGTPICYPPLGATPSQLDAMEQILANLRTNAQGYVIMPGPKAATGSGQGFGQGWLLEYLAPGQASSHGTGRDPQPALKYHTDKIAAAFIAEFIRLGHSLTGGNKGIAENQSDPFLVSVEAVAGLIEDIINAQLVAPIVAYNRPNAKGLPRLKMSLVDNTTLSELADFLLKLIQVGALIPDQQLEDFLRSRADLPPADPIQAEERGSLDASLRREVLMGKNGGGGAPTGTNAPAGSSTGGSASGSKGTDNKDKAAAPQVPQSAHEVLTKRALKTLDALPLPYQERWRPVAPYELSVDLDGIEHHLDTAPQRMIDHTTLPLHQVARALASGARVGKHDVLKAKVQHILDDAYDFGAQMVSDEIERKAQGLGYQLAAASGLPRADTAQRAGHMTSEILDRMHHAAQHARSNGYRPADMQRHAERAGVAAVKSLARTHASHAFNEGRHDRILDALPGMPGGVDWGVVYTAILDKNTCPECRASDDGVVRALDDPVRLTRKPPNPGCDSTMGGDNQCRCFEIPEPMPQGA